MLVDALLAVFESRMSTAHDVSALRVLMREVFPSSVRLRTSHSHRPAKHTAASNVLNKAIVTQLRASGLQPVDSLVDKVRLLYSSLLLISLFTLLVHGQVTIIFLVSVCLSVCLFVQSFSQPSLIRFRSN